MPKYECKKISIDKLPVGNKGVVLPLCNLCQSGDCENPIEECYISVFGVNTKYRLFVSNNNKKMVIACEGFIGKK